MTAAPPAPIHILDGPTIRRVLALSEAIPLMERTMAAVSAGKADLPLRLVMPIGGSANLLGVMPGHLADPAILGVKLISLFPENPARGLSSHTGLLILFDTGDGRPRALCDAAAITAIRTAAATAVATQALARADADDLAILGTGEQAAMHLQAMAIARPLRRVRLWGRDPAKARAFAAANAGHSPVAIEPCADVRAAIAGASLICTVTGATDPILHGADLAPGAHVNLVGASVATASEADTDTVRLSRFFVDYRPSALAQAGELKRAIDAGIVDARHIAGEIGDVLLGRVAGRTAADQITVYKSLGIAAQDLSAAHHALERALAIGAGTTITI